MTVFGKKLTRRSIAVLAVALVAVLCSSALAAYAYWGLRSSSSISVSAGSVQAPTVSCTQMSRNQVRIDWSGDPVAGVTGYNLVISRNGSQVSNQDLGPGTTSITDANARGGNGSKTYAVTASYGSWQSPASSTGARAASSGIIFISYSITCN